MPVVDVAGVVSGVSHSGEGARLLRRDDRLVSDGEVVVERLLDKSSLAMTGMETSFRGRMLFELPRTTISSSEDLLASDVFGIEDLGLPLLPILESLPLAGLGVDLRLDCRLPAAAAILLVLDSGRNEAARDD